MQRDSYDIYGEFIEVRENRNLGEGERAQKLDKLIEEYREARRLELQIALETTEFLLDCRECDVGSPGTYEQAIVEGWVEIAPDDGPRWNFLGLCPECKEDEQQ
jgi:hypothetical protein